MSNFDGCEINKAVNNEVLQSLERILISFSIFKPRSFLFFFHFGFFADAKNCPESEMYAAAASAMDQSNWMQRLEKFGKSTTKLIELCIPGSHNCGTYSMNVEMPMAPDAPEVARFFDSPSIRQLVKNWSCCQQISIGEQLKLGVRYFDFRVAYRLESAEFHIVHGLL